MINENEYNIIGEIADDLYKSKLFGELEEILCSTKYLKYYTIYFGVNNLIKNLSFLKIECISQIKEAISQSSHILTSNPNEILNQLDLRLTDSYKERIKLCSKEKVKCVIGYPSVNKEKLIYNIPLDIYDNRFSNPHYINNLFLSENENFVFVIGNFKIHKVDIENREIEIINLRYKFRNSDSTGNYPKMDFCIKKTNSDNFFFSVTEKIKDSNNFISTIFEYNFLDNTLHKTISKNYIVDKEHNFLSFNYIKYIPEMEILVIANSYSLIFYNYKEKDTFTLPIEKEHTSSRIIKIEILINKKILLVLSDYYLTTVSLIDFKILFRKNKYGLRNKSAEITPNDLSNIKINNDLFAALGTNKKLRFDDFYFYNLMLINDELVIINGADFSTKEEEDIYVNINNVKTLQIMNSVGTSILNYPNSNLLLTAKNNRLFINDYKTNKSTLVYYSFNSDFRDLVYSKKYNILITYNSDKSIKTFKLSNKAIPKFPIHNGIVKKIINIKGTSNFISYSSSGEIFIFEFGSAKYKLIGKHNKAIIKLVIHPNNNLIISSSDNKLKIWDIKKQDCIVEYVFNYIQDFDITPNASQIVLKSNSQIYVLGVYIQNIRCTNLHIRSTINSKIKVLNDNQHLIVAYRDGNIQLFDFRNTLYNIPLFDFGENGYSSDNIEIELLENGIIICIIGNSIRIIDLSTLTIKYHRDYYINKDGFYLSKSKKKFLIGSELYDINSCKRIKNRKDYNPSNGKVYDISLDDRFTVSVNGKTITIYEFNGNINIKYTLDVDITCASFSNDMSSLVVGDMAGNLLHFAIDKFFKPKFAYSKIEIDDELNQFIKCPYCLNNQYLGYENFENVGNYKQSSKAICDNCKSILVYDKSNMNVFNNLYKFHKIHFKKENEQNICSFCYHTKKKLFQIIDKKICTDCINDISAKKEIFYNVNEYSISEDVDRKCFVCNKYPIELMDVNLHSVCRKCYKSIIEQKLSKIDLKTKKVLSSKEKVRKIINNILRKKESKTYYPFNRIEITLKKGKKKQLKVLQEKFSDKQIVELLQNAINRKIIKRVTDWKVLYKQKEYELCALAISLNRIKTPLMIEIWKKCISYSNSPFVLEVYANTISTYYWYDEALKALQKSIRINKLYAPAWNKYAKFLDILNDVNKSSNAYNLALSLSPNNTSLLKEAAIFFSKRTNNYTKAKDIFNKLLTNEKSDYFLREIYKEYGDLELLNNNFNEAINLYKKNIELYEDYSILTGKLLLKCADIYRNNLINYNKAYLHFEKAIKSGIYIKPIKYAIYGEILLEELDNPQKALSYFNRVGYLDTEKARKLLKELTIKAVEKISQNHKK